MYRKTKELLSYVFVVMMKKPAVFYIFLCGVFFSTSPQTSLLLWLLFIWPDRGSFYISEVYCCNILLCLKKKKKSFFERHLT